MSLQKFVLSAAIFAVVCGFGISSFAADKTADAKAEPAKEAAKTAPAALTKEDVEKMMHDYIMANPKLIMDSVDAYQEKVMKQRQDDANKNLDKNKESLLRDPATPEAGNKKGDVTVVEFFDYNCHFCKGAFPALQSLIESDKNVRVLFKELPILGPTSVTAAKWALAADKQKKYYAFHTAMMNNKEPISDDLLERVAKEVGMDVDAAKAYIQSPDVLTQLEKNRTVADDLGISGTPAFVIGDNIQRGAIPLEEMQKDVSAARAKK